jgi:WD40 repeat protein
MLKPRKYYCWRRDYFMQAQIHRDQVFWPIKDETIVMALAFSPDGQYLATAGMDSEAKIWQVKIGLPICSVSHEDIIVALAFSPDGQYFATASEDGTAQIWQSKTGRRVACLPHRESVRYVGFIHDGLYLVTLTGSRIFPGGDYASSKITAWEVSTGKKVLQIVNHAGVETISSGSRGQYFALADKKLSVQLWPEMLPSDVLNAEKSQLERKWEFPKNEIVNCMKGEEPIKEIVLSSNKKTVAILHPGGVVQVWQLSRCLKIAHMLHEEEVNSVSFCPRGECIVTASDDNITRVWNIRSAQQLAHFTHTDAVNIAIFNPTGNLIASAAGDPMSESSEAGVRLWSWKSDLNKGRASNAHS